MRYLVRAVQQRGYPRTAGGSICSLPRVSGGRIAAAAAALRTDVPLQGASSADAQALLAARRVELVQAATRPAVDGMSMEPALGSVAAEWLVLSQAIAVSAAASRRGDQSAQDGDGAALDAMAAVLVRPDR